MAQRILLIIVNIINGNGNYPFWFSKQPVLNVQRVGERERERFCAPNKKDFGNLSQSITLYCTRRLAGRGGGGGGLLRRVRWALIGSLQWSRLSLFLLVNFQDVKQN